MEDPKDIKEELTEEELKGVDGGHVLLHDPQTTRIPEGENLAAAET